jgi:hypothetical protein
MNLARKVSPAARARIAAAKVRAPEKVPASFTSLILNTSPSLMFTVMKMSSFSGADGDLRGFHVEVRVATIHLEGAAASRDRPCSDSRE